MSRTARQIVVRGNGFRYAYSLQRAAFDSMTADGVALLEKPMELNIWRAPTDNDRNIRLQWAQWGYDRTIPRAYETDVEAGEDCVRLTTRFSVGAVYLPNIVRGTVVWTIRQNGAVRAEFDVRKNPDAPMLPRFGVRMFLPGAMRDVTYFGYGPYESYIDKRRASYQGLFRADVAELHEAIGKSDDPVPEPVIKAVYLKGYKLKDRVIRHAKVMVSMPDGTVKPAAKDGASGPDEADSANSGDSGASATEE